MNRQAALYWLVALVGRTLPAETTPSAGDLAVRILDQELWDYVDELWSCIGGMVQRLANEDEVSTYFPDQPIRLAFKRLGGGLVLVSLAYDDVDRTVSVGERELVDALQQSGTEFFTRMKALLPENALGTTMP